MRLKMWMYDYAREQAPSSDQLRELCRLSLDSGYNALGLYLEHRFAYPSAPWACDEGALPVDEFGDYGPVQLFRNNFIAGYERLLEEIAARRR